jgi:phosphatidylinositol glycan class S
MTLADWIAPYHLQSPKTLRRRFLSGTPFPHLVLRDFLQRRKADALRDALRKERFELKEGDLFRMRQTGDLRGSGNRLIQEHLRLFGSQEFRAYIASITGEPRLKKIDAAGQIYAAGDHLLPHDDRLEGRKIAYVMQLTEGFTPSDGGQLQFFGYDATTKRPAKVLKSFTPTFNTLFLFKVSTRSFHQVREVVGKGERISITGWFYG